MLAKGFDWQEKITKLESDLEVSIDDFFVSVNFSQYINQRGINKYNQVVGGIAAQAGATKVQGLNELINLARQQLDVKRQQFPPLQLLYKQILSKGDKPFIDAFKNSAELVTELNEFIALHIDHKKGLLSQLQQELADNITSASTDKAHIYIAKDKLTILAHGLTGSWQEINRWFEKTHNDNTLKKLQKQPCYSVAQLESCFAMEVEGKNFYQTYVAQNENSELVQAIDENNVVLSWFEYQVQQALTLIAKTSEQYKQLGIVDLDKDREKAGDKGFEQIAKIKSLLDACNELNHFLNHFKANKKLPQDKADFWYSFIQTQLDAFPIFELYNKVRNFVTQKPFSSEKLKINFGNGTLLDGWDRNKETDNYGVLFEKSGAFYLGIMSPDSNALFDYEVSESDSANKSKQKEALKCQLLACGNESSYRKINYKLLPGPNKMLPKVFFAKSNLSYYQPSEEIIKIKNNKLYSKAEIEKHGIENLHKYIDFCQKSLCKHPEWAKAFNFTQSTFKTSSVYQSVDEFYREVEQLGYSITFDNIKMSYIDEKVANGELYLFQIYNKDFSTNKTGAGKDNLHTSYWKLLFEQSNLNNVVLKLNGQAEIFYRPASIKYSDEKRKIGHHAEALQGKFNYPILKDRRYSVDKFLFHCPITLNFKAAAKPIRFNEKVQQFLKNNQLINVIGIDRGEKHLLYFSVVDQQGNLLDQGSFNTIVNSYQTAQGQKNKVIDYHRKLSEKEKSRDESRKSWSAIENIKELKSGYLSHVVHQLAKLIIKYNAIVVLEDLNVGFKRGRFKIEKQVYQKFEKALIDKLNYLVFKDRENREQVGHYLNAYQLTNKFKSFKELGKQSGILFYTTAAYTSTTDPVTGFIKNIYKNYQSVPDSIAFWQSFDAIIYNQSQDRFEFSYDITKVKNKSFNQEKTKTPLIKKQWTICSNVIRSFYVPETKAHELFVVTDKIKSILTAAGLSFIGNSNIQELLVNCQSKQVHSNLIKQLNFILNMRVTDSSKASGSSENDFILSPVEPFFDSRKSYQQLPENGDANGAYNIARKGLIMLSHIDKTAQDKKIDLVVTKEEWQNYTQQEKLVVRQKAKLR